MKKFYSLVHFSYPEAANAGANQGRTVLRIVVPIFALILLTCFTFINSVMFEAFGLVFAIVCASLGFICNVKPSIYNTFPVNYKKRTAYYFADLFINTLLCILIFAVVFLAWMILFIGIEIISQVASGSAEIVEDAVEAEEIAMAVIPGKAFLFSFFRTVLFCAVSSAVFRIEKTRNFIIALVAFLAVFFGGNFILTGLIGSMTEGFFYLYAEFDLLPNPWLAVALCGALAVAAVVGAVAFVLRKEKPKNF